jgi:hypothetical protein
MATVVLRPSGTVFGSVGSFKDHSGFGAITVHSQISDEDNSTYVYNSSANQSFTVELDNTSGLSGATFNNFVVTAIFQKHSARTANAKFKVEIGDSSSITTFGSVADTVFVTTNTIATTINATAINFGGSVSSSDVDDMRVKVSTTGGTQVRLFELSLTIDYTEGSSGYGNDVNGVASANIGKVDGVATANIEKIIGV